MKSHKTQLSEDCRGVSEVVQFTLILGISVVAIFGGIYVGIDILSGIQTDEEVQTAQSDITGLQTDQNNIVTGSPHISSVIGLSGGSLEYTDPGSTTFTIIIEYENDIEQLEVAMQPFVLSLDDAQMYLENGAVIREEGSESLIVSEPFFDITDSQSSLYFMNTTQDGGESHRAGDVGVTASVSQIRLSQESIFMNPLTDEGEQDTATVQIVVESPRYSAWELYFDLHDDFTISELDEENELVIGEFETEQVIAQAIELGVRFE